MTTFLLVRHAAHDWLGRGIPGRLPGVSLNEEGRQQAEELAQRLRDVPLEASYVSPQQRTHETIAPLARLRNLRVGIEPGFDEVDFGQWSGLDFDALRAQGAAWTQWCERRGSARAPGGEEFAHVPERALASLRRLQRQHAGNVLLVSHADVIKAVLAHCLGMPLDNLEQFDVSPASVSVLAMGEDWHKVLLVNGTGSLPVS